ARPANAIWNVRTEPSLGSKAANIQLPRRHDERARVDFPARCSNTWPRRRKSRSETTVQWGGYDGDFTQDAAQEFRGCGRRIELRWDAGAGTSGNAAHRPDLRLDR